MIVEFCPDVLRLWFTQLYHILQDIIKHLHLLHPNHFLHRLTTFDKTLEKHI